jgi:hypothetical protein
MDHSVGGRILPSVSPGFFIFRSQEKLFFMDDYFWHKWAKHFAKLPRLPMAEFHCSLSLA